MSSELAILVPVLRRPHRVAPLLESIEATTPKARVVFLCDPNDPAEHKAIRKARASRLLHVDSVIRGGSYAAKINEGVRLTHEPLLFLAADDLTPQTGWFEAAVDLLKDGIHVVGVNDEIRRRRPHTTHFLVSREYAERPVADGGPGPLCERYDHSFVDDELLATARQRGVYAFAPKAVVRHEHPMTHTAPDDATYRKGRARFRQDRELFEQRQALWT